MKRKILFADVTANISILALFLSVVSLVMISGRLIEVHKQNNGYYSASRQAFTIGKKTCTYDDIKKLYSECMEGTILYKEMTQLEDLRGVLIKGDIQAPPVISGRFFIENDFYKKKYLAVVGVKQKEKIYVNGKRSYIDIGEHPYEVIGIAGNEKRSCLLNYSIYANLDSFSEVNNNAGPYHLDGTSGENVKKSLEQFKADIKQISLSDYGVINVFFGELPGFLLMICISFAFISFYLFFSYIWFCSHRKLFNITDLLGVSKNERIKEAFILYIKTVLPAFTIVFIACMLLLVTNAF